MWVVRKAWACLFKQVHLFSTIQYVIPQHLPVHVYFFRKDTLNIQSLKCAVPSKKLSRVTSISETLKTMLASEYMYTHIDIGCYMSLDMDFPCQFPPSWRVKYGITMETSNLMLRNFCNRLRSRAVEVVQHLVITQKLQTLARLTFLYQGRRQIDV